MDNKILMVIVVLAILLLGLVIFNLPQNEKNKKYEVVEGFAIQDLDSKEITLSDDAVIQDENQNIIRFNNNLSYNIIEDEVTLTGKNKVVIIK